MCDARRPLNGADSAIDVLSADNLQGEADWYLRPFTVTLDGDDGERITTRVKAIGVYNARGLAQDKYPGFTAVKVEEAA